jgi:hypothetical protein
MLPGPRSVYLALIVLAGLAINAFWKVSWADPVAALIFLPLIARGMGSKQGQALSLLSQLPMQWTFAVSGLLMRWGVCRR